MKYRHVMIPDTVSIQCQNVVSARPLSSKLPGRNHDGEFPGTPRFAFARESRGTTLTANARRLPGNQCGKTRYPRRRKLH